MLTRKELLKLGGAAAIAVVAPMKVAEGAISEVSIKDLGAKGDGVADDTAPIQRAIQEMYNAGGGTVRIPATDQFYKTTRAIDLKSDLPHPVTVVGVGAQSFIKNIATSGGHDFAPVFRIGRLVAGTGQYSGEAQTFHAIEAAAAGDTQIKPNAPPGTFHVGDMLLIRGEYYQFGPEQLRPLKPQINVVTSLQSGGYLSLADPLADPQPNGFVAVYPYGVSYGAISNLRYEQSEQQLSILGFGAIAGGGAYRIGLSNLTMSRGASIISCNGLSRCLIENVHGSVAKKGFETAYYSHSTTLRNCSVRGLDGVNDIDMSLIITEAAHRMVVEDSTFDVRGKAPRTESLAETYGAVGFLGATRLNVISRCTVRTNRHKRAAVISGTAEKPTLNNWITDCTIVGDGADHVLRVATPGQNTGAHSIVYNAISGSGAQYDVLIGSGTNGCVVTNNVLPKGVRNLGQNNTVQNNSKTDTPDTGPR